MALRLSDLPIEVLEDNLFPFLPVRDLNHLLCTNKFFALLCSDDAVWKRKLLADFNFTGEGTARTSGWKTIYRGLYNPKVFVWGESANGRMGTKNLPRSSIYGVPFPFQLKVPNARIVDLVAGGMSFHALDSEGGVHVWGTMDGSTGGALTRDGFSEPGKRADTPLKLELPYPARSISCGRLHSAVLDRQNRVWNFVNWGRPFSLSSALLANPLSRPVQVDCGWNHTALLNSAGEVFVWWPSSGSLGQLVRQKNQELDADSRNKAQSTADGKIQCILWTTDFVPTCLPAIPALPKLSGASREEDDTPTRLVKIAGMDRIIIGLTNHGHVLKFDSLQDESTAKSGRWEYLSKFSDINVIGQHEVFSTGALRPPQFLKITHVSANFQHFVAYSTGSSSIVFIGDTKTTPTSDPQIMPELQNRSVISVAIGDYHNAALTSDGKFFTWGSFSSGALGLGDPAKLTPGQPGAYGVDRRSTRNPPPVTTPAEVRFDHGCKNSKDRFCFSVTAAGWHTGALVIDLEPNESEEDSYDMEEPEQPVHQPDETPPIANFPTGIFRIGHAGRGGMRGGLFRGGRGSRGGSPG